VPGPDLHTDALRPAAVAASAAAPARRLAELAARLGLVWSAQPARSADSDAVLTGITHDSRSVRRGDLYAALPGAKAHGAEFADDAAKAGALAVLTDEAGRTASERTGLPVLVVEEPRKAVGSAASWIYGDPSRQLRLLGVTGTNGKTTTSYLLEAGLQAAGERTGLIGTIETRIGSEVLPSVRTTPEAADLQALFAVMVERGVGAVAMEVSSHALALHRVDGTAFDVVAFTNLSQDHLDFHRDLADYFAAKARLFSPEFARAGVVNIDDEHGRRLTTHPSIPLTTVSAQGGPDADWRATSVVRVPEGSRFTAVGPGVEIEVKVGLPGQFNIANALLALATLVSAGVDAEVAARGIAAVRGVPGRMESISVGQPFTALVDYAHTPDAVSTVLTNLRETARGRIIVVLGCGGDRDRAKRPLMGAAAARLADVAVLTSDNPRSEDPQTILGAMVEGAMTVPAAERGLVVVEADRARAIGAAVERAHAGDVVVVAGKGHEQGQEVGDVVHAFDDRAVLRAAIEARRAGKAAGAREAST
jgi:UDP-N-acetylmuramoyl-L-alanyl-D-glutamate--2,6-diaminopimelate ligase